MIPDTGAARTAPKVVSNPAADALADLEATCLASALDDIGQATQVLMLDDSDMSAWWNRDAIQALRTVVGGTGGTNVLLVRNALLEAGKADSWDRVKSYFGQVVVSSELPRTLDAIRAAAMRRNVVSALDRSQARAANPQIGIEDLQSLVIQDLATAFATARTTLPTREKDALFRLATYLREQQSQLATDLLKTGIEDLDRVIGGLGMGEPIVFASRPRMGKTTLALQIARHVALQGDVLFISLEMVERAMAKRISCQELQIPSDKIEPDEVLEVAELRSRNLWIDEERFRPERLEQHIERFRIQRPNLKLVVIDHLGIFAGAGADYKATTTASNCVRDAAKATGIPILLLAQLSRKLEDRPDKRPQLADLNMSGSIEQDARKIVFLHRPYVYDKKGDPMSALAIVAKNSEGEEAEIPLRFNGPLFTFSKSLPQHEKREPEHRPSFVDRVEMMEIDDL